MKNFLMMALCGLIAVSAQGQQKQAPETQPTNNRWVIYWGSYKEWGHGEHCRGWGLCQYQDCWFCDVDDRYKAQVIFDDKTRQGEMQIALDPADALQKKAIDGKLVFTVSETIENPNSTLFKGNYAFDKTVGQHGGYRLKIYVKNK